MNIINSVRLGMLALKYCLPSPHLDMNQEHIARTTERLTHFFLGEWRWERKLSLKCIGAVTGDEMWWMGKENP